MPATGSERVRKHREANRANRAKVLADHRAALPPKRALTDFAGAAAELVEATGRILMARLPEMGGRDLAIAYGIAVDKHLDYTQGRRAAVALDQSQHLSLPPGTTLADLRALRDQLRLAVPQEEAGALPEVAGAEGQP